MSMSLSLSLAITNVGGGGGGGSPVFAPSLDFTKLENSQYVGQVV
jgi:hypothetical protein